MVKAKPLEWGDGDKNGGFYCNVKLGTGFEAYYDITQLEYGLAEVSYGVVCHEFGDKVIWRGPKDQAKAAAQAHADQLVADMAQPVTPQEAAKVLLEAVDAFMGGDNLTEAQNELQKSAFIAGSFAGAAYDAHFPKSGGEYHGLTRAFLLALIDPTHEDLDYLRADPSSGRVAREADAALRAIATPPQENALQELADLGQEFDAAPQSGEGE